MKQIQKAVFALLLTVALCASFPGFAATDPPNPPGSHGATNDQAGGGAPIGGGLFILLGLGAAYGGKKLYDSRKESLEE